LLAERQNVLFQTLLFLLIFVDDKKHSS